jgi:hypothetical protein
VFQTNAVEKIKTHILCSTIFFENHAVYEIIWKNTVESEGPQTAWRMSIACWICQARDTHSEYAIVIAFPLQQWLHERASMLSLVIIRLQI